MITIGAAREAARTILIGAGLGNTEASGTADAIVLADVWGVSSHGLMRLPYYVSRLRAGGYNPNALLRPVTDTGAICTFDGDGGVGHWQISSAAETARDRCLEFGIAAVAVGNSGHCGALGVYTLPALAAGLLTLVVSNGPAVMPPWKGRVPVLSTSPLAAGLPTLPGWTIVDMASSSVARGRVAEYAARREQVPEGWGFAADGSATTDPGEVLTGMLAPFGGAKGYALALVIEALTGAAVGPRLSTDVTDMFDPTTASEPQGIAHLVVTIDPSMLDSSAGRAEARFSALARSITAAEGRLPGANRRPLDEYDPATVLGLPSELEETLDSLRPDGAGTA